MPRLYPSPNIKKANVSPTVDHRPPRNCWLKKYNKNQPNCFDINENPINMKFATAHKMRVLMSRGFRPQVSTSRRAGKVNRMENNEPRAGMNGTKALINETEVNILKNRRYSRYISEQR